MCCDWNGKDILLQPFLCRSVNKDNTSGRRLNDLANSNLSTLLKAILIDRAIERHGEVVVHPTLGRVVRGQFRIR